MTNLHCRHCGGAISSESRRVQCSHCGALFPFACHICNRNLRTPFPVFADERYLTLEEIDVDSGARVESHPLCQDHFLRKCPDCGVWYHAHENEGFFRCINCAEEQRQKRLARAAETPIFHPPVEHPLPAPVTSATLTPNLPTEGGLGENARAGTEIGESHWPDAQLRPKWDLNSLALASACGALLALIIWFFMNGFNF